MMKFNILIYSIAFTILILAGSCKKNNPVVPINVVEEKDSCYCKPLIESQIDFGCGSCNIDFDQTFYDSPVLNPNNPNEVVFTDGIYPDSRLVYFNMETNEKRVLFNDDPSGYSSWSKKNWVMFQRTTDFNIYKIKSNGDSLTQLTYGGKWFHGQWNYAGDKFIVFNKTNNLSKSFIMNEQGTVVDSLTNWKHQAGSWSHPLYYLGVSGLKIVVMDIGTKTIIKQLNFEKDITFANWVSLNEIMYGIGTKLFVYNIETNKTKVIKCQCHKYISRATFSSDFSKLIFITVEDSLQQNNRIFQDSKIILMNKDGSGELEVLH